MYMQKLNKIKSRHNFRVLWVSMCDMGFFDITMICIHCDGLPNEIIIVSQQRRWLSFELYTLKRTPYVMESII